MTKAIGESPKLVSMINRFGGIASRLGISQKPFSTEAIISTAIKKTGYSDLGNQHFFLPLQKLIESYQNEKDLTFIGHEIAFKSLVHFVSNRLCIQHDLNCNPDIHQQEIRKPLFVIGLPRSGTSLLYNLLALDKNARPLMSWESMFPSKPKEAKNGKPDPRKAEAERQIKRLNSALPDLQSIHEFNAQKPDECLGLLLNTFVTPFFRGRISLYREWLYNINDTDVHIAYREYAEQLKLLQWQHANQHWVLKSPSHLFGLDALVKEFPDACIVQTHRDPAKMIPSLCSLSASLDSLFYEETDLREIGQRTVNIFDQLTSRAFKARQTSASDRFIDIQYTDLLTNPAQVVEKIYDYFDYEMSDDLYKSIDNYILINQQHKFGKHSYSLEDFGLNKEQLINMFSTYYQYFDIQDEA